LINLDEFSTVTPQGNPILRFQLMFAHDEEDKKQPVELMKTASMHVEREMAILIDS
jgi:hypothetical protein